MDCFAHPIERELARLYDAHGIAWECEPHTIVLERNSDGGIREAFTPDSYLPNLDMYVECTVVHQRLTSRKQRKVRKARENSGLTIEILFRRDFERLAGRWDLGRPGVRNGTDRGRCLTIRRAGNHRSGIMREPSMDTGVEPFRIDEERVQPQTTVLDVVGDADLHSAPELRERLRSAIDDGATILVLDLSHTTLVDSTSLGVLLGAMKRLREHDGQIRLVVPRPEIRRVFEITMLDRIFPLFETRTQAIAGETV
jgi:anti-sigma B factor antagonist